VFTRIVGTGFLGGTTETKGSEKNAAGKGFDACVTYLRALISKCKSPRAFLRKIGAYKVTRFIHIGRDGYVEKSDHHFIVGLVTPTNGHIGIGIVWIVF
jgi:hypothetical protein